MIPDVLAYVLSHPGHLYRVTRFEPLPPVAECMAFEVRFSDMAEMRFQHIVTIASASASSSSLSSPLSTQQLTRPHPLRLSSSPPAPSFGQPKDEQRGTPSGGVFVHSIAFTHTHTTTVTQQVRVESDVPVVERCVRVNSVDDLTHHH